MISRIPIRIIEIELPDTNEDGSVKKDEKDEPIMTTAKVKVRQLHNKDWNDYYASLTSIEEEDSKKRLNMLSEAIISITDATLVDVVEGIEYVDLNGEEKHLNKDIEFDAEKFSEAFGFEMKSWKDLIDEDIRMIIANKATHGAFSRFFKALGGNMEALEEKEGKKSENPQE